MKTSFTVLMIASGSLVMSPALHAAEPAGVEFTVKLETVMKHDDGKFLWFHPRAAAIRKEYLASVIETRDGRVLAGVNADQSGGNLTLGIATGERIVIPQTQVLTVRESAVSIMPEGLLKLLKPQELRDLFSYLESK